MTTPSKREDKRARLEQQLRDNLKRRKEQARARREAPPPGEDEPDAGEPENAE